MVKKINTSVAFDPDIITRIQRVKGRLSRSAFINYIMDAELTKLEEQKEAMLALVNLQIKQAQTQFASKKTKF